jgi:hypothetical protein
LPEEASHAGDHIVFKFRQEHHDTIDLSTLQKLVNTLNIALNKLIVFELHFRRSCNIIAEESRTDREDVIVGFFVLLLQLTQVADQESQLLLILGPHIDLGPWDVSSI